MVVDDVVCRVDQRNESSFIILEVVMRKRALPLSGSFTYSNVLSYVGGRKIRACLTLASVVASVAGSALMVPAATLTWDPTFVPTAPVGGTGTWNLSNLNWSNGASDVVWSNNLTDIAQFGGTAGTVALNTALSAGGVKFLSPGYTISGASIFTLGSGGIDA